MPAYAVIGGTRYVGRRVVERLLAGGADVTLITRGRASDPFGDRVTRRHADAGDAAQLSDALGDAEYDAVLHQVAYHPRHAEALISSTRGRARRLVVTSTIEVYNRDSFPSDAQRDRQLRPSRDHAEGDLDLTQQPITRDAPWDDLAYLEDHYGDGKRQVESIVLAEAAAPTANARLGHVLATDDPTGRLATLIRAVTEGGLPDGTGHAASSFVHADDAAAVLVHLMATDLTGPVNVAAQPALTLADLAHAIADTLGGCTSAAGGPDQTVIETPFAYTERFAMDTSRLLAHFRALTPPESWLARTIHEIRELGG